jgi:hypothetical protein
VHTCRTASSICTSIGSNADRPVSSAVLLQGAGSREQPAPYRELQAAGCYWEQFCYREQLQTGSYREQAATGSRELQGAVLLQGAVQLQGAVLLQGAAL